MSHTSRFILEDGTTATIIHNSDWSGMAQVMWATDDEESSVEIPAALLIELGSTAAFHKLRDALISVIESWPESL